MDKILWNTGWKVREGVADPFEAIFTKDADSLYRDVLLPHDEMIVEQRDPLCQSGKQSGYYPSKSYTFIKTFIAPEAWRDQCVLLRFDGVMSKAMVYLNDNFVVSNKYGYLQFYANLAPYLQYGKKNVLKVISITQEKSSRWYTGSGIYRDVWLYCGGSVHITPETLRVSTRFLEKDFAVLNAKVCVHNDDRVQRQVSVYLCIADSEGKKVASGTYAVTIPAGGEGTVNVCMDAEGVIPWSDTSPVLYFIRAEVSDEKGVCDTTEERFGIRTLALDSKNGLRVNGETVKLRGACIHHDNGIIGAATLYDAEYYRAKRMKDAGFNAIRSAHNPLSPAMLDACDELGIYVMDELADMWTEPKNCNDYAIDFCSEWERDIVRLVGKDYNHPCVILYSTGNEIPEIGAPSGAKMNRLLTERFHAEDGTRYVTNAISGFLAVAKSMKEYVPEEEKKMVVEGDGSEKMNDFMGKSEQEMLDAFSVSPMLTERIEEVASSLDVVGLNYLTARHALEKQLHPGRIVVGSETYPTEIARLWKIVEENEHVIGDFTWTGYDYLGEAGIGIYHYNQQVVAQGWYPDRLAYVGDIDLAGYRRPVSYLREIVYGLRRAPYVAVFRPEHAGEKFDRNNWKYHDVLESWTFPGYEGKTVRVLVLSASEEVELLVNGKSFGRKKTTDEAYTAFFELPYIPGTLTAIGYSSGKETGEFLLETAGVPAKFKLETSKKILPADGQGVAFITCDICDEKGRVNRACPMLVRIKVEGAATLFGFGTACPSGGGNYSDNICTSYDGRVLAAVRSSCAKGMAKVTFSADGIPDAVVELKVK